jgi:DNA-binding transcriptional LysR family regulator
MSMLLNGVNLNRFVVFVRVVEIGSMTGAAELLGIAKTVVSTHIQRLEAELGASLLSRTTRKLTLTEEGESFYDAARGIVESAEEAVNAVGRDASELRGTLRVTASVDFSASVLMLLVAQLSQRHPLLKIQVLSGDRLFDLVAEGIDVAIRLGRLSDSTYKAVRVAEFRSWLVAAPSVIDERSKVSKPEDLADWPFLSLSVLSQPLTHTFTGPKLQKQTVRFRSNLSANTAHSLRSAAVLGAGLTILPEFAITDDVAEGRLVRVIPAWSTPAGGVYAVFPPSRYRSQKVRALVDALKIHCEGW